MSVEIRPSRLGPVVTIRYRDKNGRQVRETLGLKAEGWSRAKALRVERQRLVSGRVKPLEVYSFKRVAEEWFNETSRRKNWKPLTLRAYTRSIERLKFFHSMPVHEIRPKDVVRFIEQHDYAAKTTNDDISVLHGILDYAVSLELATANAAQSAPRPKNGKKQWRILQPAEIQEVDKHFTDKQAQLMFRVLTRTAIRRHEIRNLRVKDIEGNVVRITDSKTEAGVRSIALPESLSAQLHEWVSGKSAQTFVFQSSTGNKVGGQWYTDQFREALNLAGIDDYVRPFHDMRHTAITNMAATGRINIVALMGVAGHKDPKVTKAYMHLAGVVFHDEAEALEERYSNGG